MNYNTKTFYLITLCASLFFSCTNTRKPDEEAKEVVEDISITEETKSSAKPTKEIEPVGLQSLKRSDCMSCHNERLDMVGPSFQKIALKYKKNEKNIFYLEDKISKGGVGTWGEIPMIAHPDLKKEEIDTMLDYILSVK